MHWIKCVALSISGPPRTMFPLYPPLRGLVLAYATFCFLENYKCSAVRCLCNMPLCMPYAVIKFFQNFEKLHYIFYIKLILSNQIFILLAYYSFGGATSERWLCARAHTSSLQRWRVPLATGVRLVRPEVWIPYLQQVVCPSWPTSGLETDPAYFQKSRWWSLKGRNSAVQPNPIPPAPEADVLPLALSGQLFRNSV